MNLFTSDIINVTKIHSVQKHETDEESVGSGRESFYQSRLSTYELVFFVSGESKTSYQGIEFFDRINSVRYMPRGVEDAGEYRVVPLRAGYCIDIYFDTDAPLPERVMTFQNLEFLQSKFKKIYTLWSERADDYYLNSMIVLYDIIKSLKNLDSAYASKSCTAMVKKSYEYIKHNFSRSDFDYEAMRRESGLSSSYFRESFRKIYHMTPNRMLNKMRMEYASELVIGGVYKISEIAEMCGFENVYYFSNAFKKHYGTPPSTYKSKL